MLFTEFISLTIKLVLFIIVLIQSQKKLPQCNYPEYDFLHKTPTFTYLPQNYDIIQKLNPNPTLHPISIKFIHSTYSQIVSQDFYRLSIKLTTIAAYYYSRIIFVQTIAPQSQTKYRGNTCQKYTTIPSQYIVNGFDPTKIDLIIFGNYFNNSLDGILCSIAGPCLVQRRPIYGLIYFQQRQFPYYSHQFLQRSMMIMVHKIMHVLGFGSMFLFFNSEATFYSANTIDDRQTYYFKNSSTSQKLKLNEVVMKNPHNSSQVMIKTPSVVKYIKEVFNCQQNLGALLSDDWSHWDKYVFYNDFMAISYWNDNFIWKFYELSFLFLADTGFYQRIDITYTDKLSYHWSKDNSCQVLSRSYPSIYFISEYRCDRFGLRRQFRDYFSSYIPIGVDICPLSYKTRRCIRVTVGTYPYDFCTNAKCIYTYDTNGQVTDRRLQLTFDGILFTGCRQGQTILKLDLINKTATCPNMDDFCSIKQCLNECQGQGICVNGQCIISPKDYKNSLLQTSSPFAICLDSSKILCRLGCSRCQCIQQNGFKNTSCIESIKGFQKIISSSNLSRSYKLKTCSYGCQNCINNQQACNSCFEGYFWFDYGRQSCGKCRTGCSQCNYVGKIGIALCSNCIQQMYIDAEQICQRCNIDYCVTCEISNAKKCSKCIDGYSLSANFQKCVPCLIGCSRCSQSNISNCLGCRQGYYMISEPIQSIFCIPCSDGCQICDSVQCFVCYQGWVPNQNNPSLCIRYCLSPCVQCVENEPFKCLSCAIGYTHNSQLKKCLPDLVCNQSTDCTFCPQGFKLQEKQCVKCQIQNCGECDSSTKYCEVCTVGYYLNYKSLCQLCPQKCFLCIQYDVCIQCSIGYSHPKNIDGSKQTSDCVSCIENCALCPSSPNQCMTCNKGYYRLGWKCVSKKYINYTITIDYPYTLNQFIESGEFEVIQKQIKNKHSLGQTSESSLISISQGSITMTAQIGNGNEQLTQQCLIYYQISQNLTTESTVNGYKVISVTITPANQTCYDYPFTIIRTQTIQTGVPIAVFIAIIVVVILLLAMIIIIFIWRSRSKIRLIQLKFEEIKSRPQYLSTSLIAENKQAL